MVLPQSWKTTAFSALLQDGASAATAPSLFISSTQPRYRLDANPKEERFNCLIAHSHLPLTQCIKPPMTGFCEQ